MDGKSHTCKYRGPQCDPEKYGQCPARVLSHVTQTEPEKKFKEEEYMLHGGYCIQTELRGSGFRVQGSKVTNDEYSTQY